MGFGHRRNYGRTYGDNGYRKKGKLKTQIRLLGVLVLLIGFLISLYDLQNHNNENTTVSVGLVVIGMVMILQKEGLKILGKKMMEPATM